MNTVAHKKYGQYLVDLVNAEDTENAVLSCFYNLQQNFSFAPDFYEAAIKSFPSINKISLRLNASDKKLLEQILKKNTIIQDLDEQFGSINYAIENYDPVSRTVSLMSLEWKRDGNDDPSQADRISSRDSGFLQTLKMLGLSIVDGPITIKLDAIRSEIEALLGSNAADRISRLVQVGHAIEELMINLDPGRYEELHLLAEDHREVIDFHQKMEAIQAECRQILDVEIDGRPFNEIPALADFVDVYNESGIHRVTIGAGGCLAAEKPFNESKYLAVKKIGDWFDIVREDTAYCLIEFLKSDKGRKFLKKCRTCCKYFMARQPHIQKYCTRQCRLNQPRSKTA